MYLTDIVTRAPFDGHLGSLHLLAFVNAAGVKVSLQVTSCSSPAFPSFGSIPDVELLGCICNFLRNYHVIFHSSHPILFFIKVKEKKISCSIYLNSISGSFSSLRLITHPLPPLANDAGLSAVLKRSSNTCPTSPFLSHFLPKKTSPFYYLKLTLHLC